MFLDYICPVHLGMSRQFVASILAIPLVEGMDGNIYSSTRRHRFRQFFTSPCKMVAIYLKDVNTLHSCNLTQVEG